VAATSSLQGSVDDTARAAAPRLFQLLHCQRPLAGSTCHALDGIEHVAIGRTTAPEVLRDGTRLTIGVPDRAMSSSHARIARDGRQWVLEDAGSRNGVMLNGARADKATLVDGDVFELGETFWLFRHRDAAVDDRPRDLESGALPEVLPGLVTFTHAFHESLAALARIVEVCVPILLQAESGTGKELCARAIHARSKRPGAFIAVNCGALTETIAASELFGHRKGAFSGATDDRPGLIRAADKGTLFLDEIGDLPLPLQTILLRVLQEHEVTPVGAVQPIPIDIQLVAASHRDLGALVRQELFRHDLYARLAGFSAKIPPLRERREDLGLLAAALLRRAPFGATTTLTPNAARALVNHDWPLNVRELETCLTVASTLANGGTIHRRHLPELVRGDTAAAETDARSEHPRRKTELLALLREHQGNIASIARATGWNRVQIHRWLKKFDLDPAPFRGR